MIMLPSYLSDVTIKTAAVPEDLDTVLVSGVLWRTDKNRLLFRMPHVADYLVENGNSVTIQISELVSASEVERILWMTPLASLLFQRGMLAMHAAALVNTKGAILIAGDSGVGKSALLLKMIQQGWRMLADDLSVVTVNSDGELTVLPTNSQIAAWPETISKMRIDLESFPTANNRRILSMDAFFSDVPAPLMAVYWLGISNEVVTNCSAIGGIDRFKIQARLLYNSHIADALLDRIVYLRLASAMASTVPLWHLIRPRSQWSVCEIADIINEKYCR